MKGILTGLLFPLALMVNAASASGTPASYFQTVIDAGALGFSFGGTLGAGFHRGPAGVGGFDFRTVWADGVIEVDGSASHYETTWSVQAFPDVGSAKDESFGEMTLSYNVPPGGVGADSFSLNLDLRLSAEAAALYAYDENLGDILDPANAHFYSLIELVVDSSLAPAGTAPVLHLSELSPDPFGSSVVFLRHYSEDYALIQSFRVGPESEATDLVIQGPGFWTIGFSFSSLVPHGVDPGLTLAISGSLGVQSIPESKALPGVASLAAMLVTGGVRRRLRQI